MKLTKYLFVLAIAFFGIVSLSNAQTVAFLGGGSSALFLELGQAAATYEAGVGTPCIWSANISNGDVAAQDNRTGSPTLEIGKIWVVWNVGTGTSCVSPAGSYNIYAFMSLDSVLGDRCYFEVDSSGTPGCVQVLTPTSSEASALGNLLCYPSKTTCTSFGDTTGGIPSVVSGALNGKHWFVAGTDIRPEDAKFASYRIFQPCGATVYRQAFDTGLRQVYGLGYQTGTTGVGTTIQSFYSSTTFHVLDFNITGSDPISGKTVPSYTVSTVGAQPIVVAVSPYGGTGIGAATDVPSWVLMLYYMGVLGRSTDLIGPTTTAPITTLVREPLSGTYNTFEFSEVNNSQFHGSQDDFNCNGSVVYSNPMNLQSTNGQALAYRRRVIGTGEMVSQIQAGTSSDQRLGYFFWSAANAANFNDTNGKYLTVNGVDPLTNGYTDGIFPGADTSHPITNVTFKYMNQGDYPIWSALRLVSQSPTPAGVTNIIAAAQTLNSTQFDFIPLSKLNVWHSHYYLPIINVGTAANGPTINPATPGDLCSTSGAYGELGGDVGGSNVLKQANADFCSDFGNVTGLINASN